MRPSCLRIERPVGMQAYHCANFCPLFSYFIRSLSASNAPHERVIHSPRYFVIFLSIPSFLSAKTDQTFPADTAPFAASPEFLRFYTKESWGSKMRDRFNALSYII